MSKNNDPLDSLISSDAKATDRKKLAELLGPYMVIDQDSREFSFHTPLHDLSGNDVKLELLLAGAKARALYFDMPDGLLPGEIISVGLMPEGSVKSTLKKLYDGHKIKKDRDGRYLLPAHRIQEVIKKLSSTK